MKYLLDVNALVALGFTHHEFHGRVAAWIKAVRFPALVTCSITELGFVRVLAQAPSYGFTLSAGEDLPVATEEDGCFSIHFHLG